LKIGQIVQEYRVDALIAQGFSGEVYSVTHINTQRKYAMKIFLHSERPNLKEYTNYQLELPKLLSGITSEHLSVPISSGVINGIIFQIYEFITGQTLKDYIQQNAPIPPIEALEIISQLASGLSQLESHNIIHGDVNPRNILLSESEPKTLTNKVRARIIDFGMVRIVDTNDSIIWAGSYGYAPPELIGETYKSIESTDAFRVRVSTEIGPHVDIYALGVITLEMLTGEATRPKPLTSNILSSVIIEKNRALKISSNESVNQLSRLICDMLYAKPSKRPKAIEVYHSVISLIQTFKESSHEKRIDESDVSVSKIVQDLPDMNPIAEGLERAISSLNAISVSVAEASAVMLRTNEKLESMGSTTDDFEIINQMNLAFENVISKSKTSWTLGILISISCFCVILGMIVCSVVLAVVTGKPSWSLVFGGASIPLIIGTILWRPYDRIFRATILSQQLEMLHLQATAGIRGTSDINRRMDIFREALAGLEALFDKHAKR